MNKAEELTKLSFTDALIKADLDCVYSEEDYQEETTVFLFDDDSILIFDGKNQEFNVKS